MIGAYKDNYGGDIEYQLGIKMMKYMLVWKHLKEKVGNKMKMY